MEELYRVLREHYCVRDEVIPSVMWNHHTGELEISERVYDSDGIRGWISKTTGRDHLTQAELKQVYAAVTENRSDGNGILKHPTFEDFCRCQENPAVMLWMEAEQDEEEIASCHGNGLTGLRLFFDAELLVNFRAIDRYFE